MFIERGKRGIQTLPFRTARGSEGSNPLQKLTQNSCVLVMCSMNWQNIRSTHKVSVAKCRENIFGSRGTPYAPPPRKPMHYSYYPFQDTLAARESKMNVENRTNRCLPPTPEQPNQLWRDCRGTIPSAGPSTAPLDSGGSSGTAQTGPRMWAGRRSGWGGGWSGRSWPGLHGGSCGGGKGGG